MPGFHIHLMLLHALRLQVIQQLPAEVSVPATLEATDLAAAAAVEVKRVQALYP